jgi:hypothetical protein
MASQSSQGLLHQEEKSQRRLDQERSEAPVVPFQI